MAPKTAPVDSADWSTLLDQLNELRLSRDWSYRQLADDITAVTGFDISAQTLQPLLSVASHERSKPYDRTLYKIRQYLAALEEGKRATA